MYPAGQLRVQNSFQRDGRVQIGHDPRNDRSRSPEYAALDKLPTDLDYEDGKVEIRRGSILEKEAVDHHCWIMYVLSQDIIAGPSKACIDKAVGKETSGHKSVS